MIVASDDALHDGWLKILDAVYRDVLDLHANREAWRFFNETLGNAGDAGLAPGLLTDWYVDSQAACIRRQYQYKDKQSLAKLMRSLQGNAHAVTLERYRSHWPELKEAHLDPYGDHSKWADQGFARWADVSGERLDPAVVERDFELLERTAKKVSRWADENVAHGGKKKSVVVTFVELHEAITVLGSLLSEYRQLLTAGSLVFPDPILPPSWKMPFMLPLLENPIPPRSQSADERQ